MDILLTYSAGKGFSFKGKAKEKSGFQQLCLYKVIKHCTQKMFPKATVAEIDKSIKDWLIACTKRENRRQKKEQKRKETESAMQLELEDEENDNDGGVEDNLDSDPENRD
ncbi:uncharacterized protein LOC127290352 [Leptopilina boulardi]|uniref:uncharacterized protein LOC127290352 n=1 Tax=Leptopilina boulardi TaxID=63433 RepID=UPI0021F58206|nr:uncharacterized protein LOC127290352 [Leptopilina boulardi]